MGGTGRGLWMVIAAFAVVAVALCYLLRIWPWSGISQPQPLSAVELSPPAKVAEEEPEVVAAVDALPREGATAEYTPAPCDGCLDGRAAREIAEAYLINIDPNYIYNDGLAVELYIDDSRKRKPPVRAEWEATGLPFSTHLANLSEPERSHTWVVWFQTGWLKRELLDNYVEMGQLPMEALSWPLPKLHSYVFVNAKTGSVWPQGIFPEQAYGIDYGVSTEPAKRAAAERADHWLGEARTNP